MKTSLPLCLALIGGLASAVSTAGETRYVNISNPAPRAPYTNWATAATVIQHAVDVALPGDEVVVTNGCYETGGRNAGTNPVVNRVVVTVPLTLRSVNGPEFTMIRGRQIPGIGNGIGAIRCVYLASGATLSGFTLTNGGTWSWNGAEDYHGEPAYSGGGVWCESPAAIVSNCLLVGNSAEFDGGGAHSGTLIDCTLSSNSSGTGGGASHGTLNNCTLSGNRAGYGRWGGYGGAAGYATLNNCTLTSNLSSAYGGGAYSGILNDCTLTGNSGRQGGGASWSTLSNCTLTSNRATGDVHGTGGGGAYFATLNNCMLNGNSAEFDGGGAYGSTLNNCTLTGNSARYRGGGAFWATLTNCIVYFNTAAEGANYSDATLDHCCATPLPTAGVGNISAEPQLVNASHISAMSPCRGAGNSISATGVDIDGGPWANPPSIGCDEFHPGNDTRPLTVTLETRFTNVATGFQVPLSAQISGHASANRWEFGDGTVLSNRPATTHAWHSAGDYPVIVRAYNQSNSGGISATVMVHVVQGTYYVAAESTNPVSPYTSWATAATTIQDAVDAAVLGALVLVTNGLYESGGRAVDPGMTNRVAVTKPLTVRSVNGPDVTVIRGYQVPGTTNGDSAVRCVYLTSGATLVGFTLTNGGTWSWRPYYYHERLYSGGGVWCEFPNATVSNCVIVGNAAEFGGSAFWGTLDGCRLDSNVATAWGGGAVRSVLSRCVLTNNSARQGGGAFNASLNQCTIAGNRAKMGGGISRCALDRCIVSRNTATGGDGIIGMGGGALSTSLTNCLVFSNAAQLGGGAFSSSLWNCIVVNNTAAIEGGGLWASTDAPSCAGLGCGPMPECALAMCHGGDSVVVNCIISDNTAPTGANHFGFNRWFITQGAEYVRYSTLDYSCTEPLPTNGVGNITNAPLFVGPLAGDFRLQSNSPCINAGRNSYRSSGFDLDGNPRIVGGTVDIGAYEFQSPQSALSYAWLQQYGLPTDGTADLNDPDQDGQSNWQEWRAWTNPRNSASALRLLTPVVSTNGLLVRWQSVSGRTYSLERGTSLAANPAFVPFASNIVGQADTTVFTDTNASGTGPLFYRLGVND